MVQFSNNRSFIGGSFSQWRRPGPITIAILVWLVAEILAFSFVVSKLGMAGALLLGLGTTVLGFAALKRLSADAMASLRKRMDNSGVQQSNFLDGTLTALGAVFLILPGFITDIAGLALLSPSLRGWLTHLFGGTVATPQTRRRPASPDVIDLDESDWRQLDDRKREHRN